ncbi:TetR family transcriptional regulator C-terminal domain-containing protein [Pseudoponticoccus marisrubri]|uniref:TetR family transcriptional regulator n=1 Tax=Pseudoponticoccus marisrubri TaxID=1685382 RepID=A0A0W7WKP5_9RHOB|nr:TetR family transcriptional regulator C-terminal domain-containing protein [Pseudoponticoccus marisrubri]KUF11187.1 TetR family transcriptional regulator [Pseudoponticoccus marisrubri]
MAEIPAEPQSGRGRTRIQKAKRQAILEAALDVFSQDGFRGATLDRIATAAGLSKPNLLYYFPSKEAIYAELLTGLLSTWLDPLRAIDPEGEPLDEMLAYVRRKLDLSRDFPRESRLFANEILRGAPNLGDLLSGDLRALVDQTAAVLRGWIAEGRLAPVDPKHTIFSIWALTQHYADFDVQICAVLGGDDPFDGAATHLETVFTRLLAPR